MRKRWINWRQSLNSWDYSTDTNSFRNLYHRVVITSICQILYPHFTLTPNTYLYDISFTTDLKIFIQPIPHFCLKTWVTHLALYFKIGLLQFFFSLKHHRSVIALPLHRNSCEFPGLIFDKKLILSPNDFSLLEPIRVINCLFQYLEFVISFVL